MGLKSSEIAGVADTRQLAGTGADNDAVELPFALIALALLAVPFVLPIIRMGRPSVRAVPIAAVATAGSRVTRRFHRKHGWNPLRIVKSKVLVTNSGESCHEPW